MGRNQTVPVGVEAGGRRKAKANMLEVECKIPAWFQKKRKITKKQKQNKNKATQSKKIKTKTKTRKQKTHEGA